MSRASLLLLLTASLPGCGGGDPQAPRPSDPSSRTMLEDGTSGPALPTQLPDSADRPAAPARVFNSRFKAFGPWFTDLVGRINPGNPSDRWPTEVIAGLARRELRAGLRAALDGSAPPLAPVLGPEFRARTPLRPARPTLEHDRGAHVERGTPAPLAAADLRAADAGALLTDLLTPYYPSIATTEVELWITAAWQEGAEFHTRGRLRLSAPALQTNVVFLAGWRIVEGRVNLTTLEGESFEEVRFAEPALADVTEHTLGDAAAPGSWLWQGALERASSTDNLVVFTDVYLAMQGMAIGDLDGDGLEDVYVARQGGEPNLLLLHQPDDTAVDVAAQAEVDFLDDTGGVLIVDLDGDGARDLVLGIGSDVVVAWNDGAGHFPERTRLERSAPDLDKVYSITAADADADGDLDLYDTRYFSGNAHAGGGVPTPYHDATNGARNSLWLNQGSRHLVEGTAALGLDDENSRFSLAALWEDLDRDGDLDLYVVNDFGRNNLYLRGDDGRYTDAAGAQGLADMAAGMGITCADANGDGVLDLYVTNMFSDAGRRVTATPKFSAPRAIEAAQYRRHTRGNSLLLGRGDGVFLDGTEAGGTGPGGWAWGAMFAALDCDGAPDLYVPNGFLTGRDHRDLQGFFWRQVVNASPLAPPADQAYLNAWKAITRLSQAGSYSWSGNERNYVYWNLGEGVFAEASRASGGAVLDDTRVGATCDWDGDGRVDLWLKNRTAPLVRLLRNQVQGAGHWLSIETVGKAGNTEAIGALVTVEAGEMTLLRRVYAGEGYLGNPSKRLHFGLGDADRVERLTVHWPDGGRTELTGLDADWRYRVHRDGTVERMDLPDASPPAVRALPISDGTPLARTVVLERLPYAPLPLPRFDGVRETLADHAGRCALLYLWGSWDDQAFDRLSTLAAAQARLDSAGVDVHPISMDGARDEPYARAVVRASGLGDPGGRATLRERVLLELACQAVLANYEDLPLPIALLFDGAGRLCVAQVGEVDLGTVITDARALLAAPEERTTTLCLTGGRWLERPERYLDKAAERLRNDRGERELADELQRFIEARQD
jgi:hypothetical protein